MATPEDFLRKYHAMSVVDARLGINATFDITRYISGMDAKGSTEWTKICGIIAGRYFGSKHWSVSDLIKQGQPFRIKGEKLVDETEPWTEGSIRRAFGGRASPEEFADGLRLAVLTGRCKAANAATYAAEHFGLDCNAFVGNWLGVSPSTSIAAYAHGYGGTPKGATKDVLVSKDIVHLPPCADVKDIRQGSVLATYTDSVGGVGNSHWRHIALVQSFEPLGGERCRITLAEWGKAGPFETHMTRNREITLTTDKKPKGAGEEVLKGKKTLAFHTTWGKESEAALRVFFDSSPLDWCESRGWEVGGLYGS
jgi:hypothetical protein